MNWFAASLEHCKRLKSLLSTTHSGCFPLVMSQWQAMFIRLYRLERNQWLTQEHVVLLAWSRPLHRVRHVFGKRSFSVSFWTGNLPNDRSRWTNDDEPRADNVPCGLRCSRCDIKIRALLQMMQEIDLEIRPCFAEQSTDLLQIFMMHRRGAVAEHLIVTPIYWKSMCRTVLHRFLFHFAFTPSSTSVIKMRPFRQYLCCRSRLRDLPETRVDKRIFIRAAPPRRAQ